MSFYINKNKIEDKKYMQEVVDSIQKDINKLDDEDPVIISHGFVKEGETDTYNEWRMQVNFTGVGNFIKELKSAKDKIQVKTLEERINDINSKKPVYAKMLLKASEKLIEFANRIKDDQGEENHLILKGDVIFIENIYIREAVKEREAKQRQERAENSIIKTPKN